MAPMDDGPTVQGPSVRGCSDSGTTGRNVIGAGSGGPDLSELRVRIERQLCTLLSDHDDRQDITQDCLIKVWRQHRSFRGEGKFTSWLHRVVKNEFLSWIRRSQRRARHAVAAGREDMAHDQEDPAEGALERITAERVLETMTSLDQTICRMRFLDGLTSAEVGSRLGLSPITVRCRSRRAARACLAHFGAETTNKASTTERYSADEVP